MIKLEFFDFHLYGINQESDYTLIKEAKRLGYSGISILYTKENYKSALEYLNEIKKDLLLDKSLQSDHMIRITPGIKIHAENLHDLKKQIRKLRNQAGILMVQGGDLKINRGACENIKVDILSRPYKKRRDCGINHVLSKEASKNNVAIELCLNDLLRSRNSYRAKIIAQFREIIKLHRKFNFPILITSGARSIYDLRTPRDLLALFQCLGMEEQEFIRALSGTPQSILEYNTLRKDMVISGVRIVSKSDNP